MNYTEFRELIAGKERDSVDFKIQCQAFLTQDIAPKAELAKDICAMANNRDITSYIIIGISDDGQNFNLVVNEKLNDDNLQSFCKLAIYPPPKIKLFRVSYNKAPNKFKGKEFVVIQVVQHIRQTFRLAKDFIDYARRIFYRRNEVWIRRGATSDLATPEEIVSLEATKFAETISNIESKIVYLRGRTKIGKVNKETLFHRFVAAGIQYERIKRYDLAIDCFEDALEINSDDIGLYLELSVIYGEYLGDPKSKNKAINYCRKALRVDKNNVLARFNLAIYVSHIRDAKYSFPIYSKAENLMIIQGLTNTRDYGKLNIFIGHDIKKIKSKEEAKYRYKRAVSILKPLADAGDKVSDFWLKDAEKNLKEVIDEIEKDKKR